MQRTRPPHCHRSPARPVFAATACKQKIPKGQLRMALINQGCGYDGADAATFRHLRCVTRRVWSDAARTHGSVNRLPGFAALTPEEQETVLEVAGAAQPGVMPERAAAGPGAAGASPSAATRPPAAAPPAGEGPSLASRFPPAETPSRQKKKRAASPGAEGQSTGKAAKAAEVLD